jgi:hypothetical protein
MAATIKSERRNSSTARVPSVPPGTAIVYMRYDEEKTVVMNPQDFHRLTALENDLAEVASNRIAFSALGLKAALEDTPAKTIEDEPDQDSARPVSPTSSGASPGPFAEPVRPFVSERGDRERTRPDCTSRQIRELAARRVREGS